MKFRNGYWLLRPGVGELAAAEVYDYAFRDGLLTVYAATRPIASRSATVDAPVLTVEISAVGKDTVRVNAYHHLGSVRRKPAFRLAEAGEAPRFREEENELVFCAGTLEVRVRRKPYRIFFFEGGKLLTFSEDKSLAYMTLPEGQGGGKPRMKEELALSVGETVYGLGERFTPFVKNGQMVELINEDGGTASEQTYKNMPFYLSSRGYGVWFDTPAPVDLEIGSEKVERVQFSVEGEEIGYCVIGSGYSGSEEGLRRDLWAPDPALAAVFGEPFDPKGVLRRLAGLTGQMALPPRWSFGLWLSTSFTTDYDEATVMGFLDGMEESGIPVEVLHFDCCWMKETEWTNFTWHEDAFPDPEGMIWRIHERGIKVCLWINPYIAQKSPAFREACENGYLLKRKDGTVWQTDRWQAGMGIVDFTNPEACRWYREKLRTLLQMGVDCFKTDFGERIPIREASWFDGSDPLRMHNYYTFLYNREVYGLLKEMRGENGAAVFARSATGGCQQFPVHWGGDCASSYRSMAESLRGGLSLMLSGLGFWSHDMGGFEDAGCTPDLYKRWTQFGLLSTHSRYHSSKRYKVPWLYGDEAVEVAREFTRLKLSLMPYLWAQAVESCRQGLPLMRPMLLEFPDDPACRTLDTQYMLGENLLVAPILNDKGAARYYLPEGSWTHYLSGRHYPGGRWYTERYDYHSLPLFVRGGSIVVSHEGEDRSAVYDDRKGARIRIYDVPREGLEARCYNEKGEEIASVRVDCDEEAMHVVAHGFDESARVVLDGAEYPLVGGVLALV